MVWLIVMSLVVLFCIYLSCTIQSSCPVNQAISTSSVEQSELYYVDNCRTKVFHISTCGFIPVVEFDDRDEAISRG